jgi:hypothetical protein
VAGCRDALLDEPHAAPEDPSDPLFYVNRWRPIPAAYPVSDTSPWMPCLGPLPRGATSDLLCLPYAYRYHTPEALRAVAFESAAPEGFTRTHDGLAVGSGGKVGFRPLLDAARAEGHDLRVRSGFRPFSSQDVVFRGWVRTELAAGLSADQAHRRASTYSAQPGHSEHQLGTTADLVYRSPRGGPFYDGWAPEKIASSGPMAWMRRHAHRFGIVLSYPKEDTAITQYVWEPWHYRFVGVAAADAMHRCGLSPEAFLNARYRAGPQPAFDLGPAHTLADRDR